MRWLCLAWCVGLCATASSLGAEDAELEGLKPIVRRIYDVGDLVHVSLVDADTTAILPPTDVGTGRRPRASGGTGLMSGSNLTPPPPPSLSERVERLTKLIETLVDPTYWSDNGGNVAQIQAYDTRLVVVAPAQTHAKLVELMADMRRQASRSVRLRASWVVLSDEELRAAQVDKGGAGGGGPRGIDVAAVERVKGAVRYRAEINALSGQRVNVTAGRARSMLSELSAAVGSGAVGMEPTFDLVLSGASLQVIPTLSDDGAVATLDLRAVVGRWDKPDAGPMKIPGPVASSQPVGSATSPPVEVERANIPVHYVTTSVKVPVGEAVLVGGMTMENEQTEDRRPLYLIVEVWSSTPAPRDGAAGGGKK